MKPITCVIALVLSHVLSHPLSAQGVNAALLRPWGFGSTQITNTFWNDLITNWASYGPTPVTIDQTTFGPGTPITEAALVLANIDVIIFADCAGGGFSFSPAEQVEIANFLSLGGKRAVGTYLTFFWGSVDSRWLLPVFGFTPNLSMGNADHGGQPLGFVNPSHVLASGLSASVPISGYNFCQTPTDSSWDPGDYMGELVAISSNNVSMVHTYRSGTYEAVYMSFMPEYGGDANARQLAYNCIAVPLQTLPTITPLALPSIGTVLPLLMESPEHPNAAFALSLSASTTPGILLSDSRVIPLTPDALFYFCLAPNNGLILHNTGFLDGSGVANAWATVSIPMLPSLVGQTVFAGMVTFDAMSSTGVGGISNALPLTIVN
jgi:hypothetical protein